MNHADSLRNRSGRPLAVCGAVLACALLLVPASPVAAKSKAKLTVEQSGPAMTAFRPPVIEDNTNFSFTVPGAASARAQTIERAFRFTPSGQPESRKALSVGVATRVVQPAATGARTLAAAPDTMIVNPRAYNVDVSVAWKGFALSTGYSHADAAPGMGTRAGGPPAALAGARDAIDVGLSYGGRNWRTSLQGSAEERTDLAFTPLERRYSVSLGGAYMVAPRLSVTGGVRYKTGPDTPNPLDLDRPDQSVYVGTNIAF
jgi:hypothetical protein